VSYQVFERATLDLLKAIQHFNDLARDGTLFGHTRRNEIDEMEQLIQKELFAAANAAHRLSIIPHAEFRRLPTSRLRTTLTTDFWSDGLHEFVIALRTMLHTSTRFNRAISGKASSAKALMSPPPLCSRSRMWFERQSRTKVVSRPRNSKK